MPSKEVRVFMAGIEAAGKTTIVSHFTKATQGIAEPTIGWNISTLKEGNLHIAFWEVGGGEKVRSIWRAYLNSMGGVIIVIDISDKKKLEYAVSEIKKYLLEFISDEIPILVFGNKSDKALIDITRV